MSNFDPSKHPRKPRGSDRGGEFTRVADRAAAAQTTRMDKAHEDAKKYAYKLAQGKTEEEIAREVGYPPGHEQHWAFRNGLVQAAPVIRNPGHTARQIKTGVTREAAQRGGLARITSSSAWSFTTHYKDGSKNQWAFNRGDITNRTGIAPLGKMLADLGARHGASVVSRTVPLPKLTRAPKGSK
jgi:hypothetical protein